MNITDAMIDTYFLFDIAISMNSGFYDAGILNIKRKDIMKNYAKTWLGPDLISSFPYSFLFLSSAISN